MSLRHRSLFSRPAAVKKPRRRSRVLHILGTAFRRMLIVLGAFLFLSILLVFFMSWKIVDSKEEKVVLPSHIVLRLSTGDGFLEHENDAGPYSFTQRQMVIRDVVDTLDRAAGDARVKGLLLDFDGAGLNIAHLEELRAAILRFRESERFAYVYATSYGEPGQGLGAYYLVSAFDEIWMQPMGLVSVAGLRAELPFFRDTLDKIGVEPQFVARKEYKSVFENVMNREMTPQSREMMDSLISDMAGHFIRGIAAARDKTPEAVRQMLDKGLYMDQEAVQAGLVSKLDDLTALEEHISTTVTGRPDSDKIFVNLKQYSEHTPARPSIRAPAVALVYAVGTIASAGQAAQASAGYGDMAVAEELADDIARAADDKDIRAIVVRIDSPGGSPVASETIRLALLRAKEKGKAVVVSMGATAASGGYWIATPANYIVALPQTLTGSIGVAGGKFVLEDLWTKLGVNWDTVSIGRTAGMWSFNQAFTPEESAIVNAMMDSVYDGFVARVAEGRGMTPAQVDAIARGRVWSGAQAKEKGLVDALGGLDAALDYTARELGGKNRHDLRIVVLPEPKTPVQRLAELLQGQAMIGNVLKILSAAPVADAPVAAYEPLRIR